MEEPGAVGELALEVEFGLVVGVGLPHFPDDFEPEQGLEHFK